MRQYANPKQSGTMQTSFRSDPELPDVIERVMAIANRLVAAENALMKQINKTRELESTVESLTNKVENLTLRSEGKEFKKPTPTRAKKATTTTKIESTDS